MKKHLKASCLLQMITWYSYSHVYPTDFNENEYNLKGFHLLFMIACNLKVKIPLQSHLGGGEIYHDEDPK